MEVVREPNVQADQLEGNQEALSIFEGHAQVRQLVLEVFLDLVKV